MNVLFPFMKLKKEIFSFFGEIAFRFYLVYNKKHYVKVSLKSFIHRDLKRVVL